MENLRFAENDACTRPVEKCCTSKKGGGEKTAGGDSLACGLPPAAMGPVDRPVLVGPESDDTRGEDSGGRGLKVGRHFPYVFLCLIRPCNLC
jgi:hypothetical protein